MHPSDTASALVALDATIRIVGPSGARSLPASEFFALPTRNPARENVLEPTDVLAEMTLPPLKARTRSTYHKVMDREAWTHAVVAAAIVLEMDGADLHACTHRAQRRRPDAMAGSGSRTAAGRSARDT